MEGASALGLLEWSVANEGLPAAALCAVVEGVVVGGCSVEDVVAAVVVVLEAAVLLVLEAAKASP